MPVWTAEIAVDEELVRGLLTRFAELEIRSLRRLAEGWDNSVWVVDERYAFRFPRRAIAIPGIERETAVLPQFAPLLPLPVPRPAFVGPPTDEYPWPFFGCELLPGVEAGDAALGEDARVEIGLELARFLRALHAIELDEPLPLDFNGRADMAKRSALAREELAELERLGCGAPGASPAPARRGRGPAAARASGTRPRRPPLPPPAGPTAVPPPA